MSGGATCAIVPVKALAQAKRRLAPVLPDAARRRLVLAMLEDVLAAVARTEGIERVLVVTPDASAASLAESRGAVIVPEPGAGGLNAAVESAIAFALSRGARPGAGAAGRHSAGRRRRSSRASIASRRSRPGVTLAPSHDSDGTNALLLAPPNAIAPCYGPGSYVQHMSQAMARHIDVNVLHLAGVARDIDEPADLAVLSAAAPARYGFLEPYLVAAGQASDPTAAAEEQ